MLQKIRGMRWLTRLLPFMWLLVIVAIFAIATQGRFLSAYNVKIIIDQSLIVGTVATGAMFIFASGNINLATGAVTALTAALVANVYLRVPSIPLMVISAIVIGAVIMYASALLSARLHVPVIFVTIVMMNMLSSIEKTIVGPTPIYLPFEMTKVMKEDYFPYLAFVLFFLACAVLFYLFDTGRALKFIGANPVCAEQTGLYSSNYLLIASLICGIGVGLASIMTIVRTASVSIDTASSLNMDCMLALVLGGMSIFGGSKSYLYAGILGAVTVSALNNGLNFVGIPPEIIQGIRGIVFILFICTSQVRPQGLPTSDA